MIHVVSLSSLMSETKKFKTNSAAIWRCLRVLNKFYDRNVPSPTRKDIIVCFFTSSSKTLFWLSMSCSPDSFLLPLTTEAFVETDTKSIIFFLDNFFKVEWLAKSLKTFISAEQKALKVFTSAACKKSYSARFRLCCVSVTMWQWITETCHNELPRQF